MSNQKLLSLFQRVNMTDNDKDFWMVRLGNLPEHIQESIIMLFELYPENMAWLRMIQERKERAFANLDWSNWRTIIQEEETFFASAQANA